MTSDQPTVTLYTYALSPFGMKVYWALIYKQIAFDLCYVSPRGHQEIAFTEQRVVPVLMIGDEWRLDSGPLCQWLDERFPATPFAGETDQERRDILLADQWVTENLIALGFRLAIDEDTKRAAFKNGRKLAQIMRQTSGGIPWWAQFVWSKYLRRTGFIRRAAAMTDMTKPFTEVAGEIVEAFDHRLGQTGFIAGTSAPSYADLAAFAQLACAADLKLNVTIGPDASPAISEWFERMLTLLPAAPTPPLIKGRPSICETWRRRR